MLVGVLRLASSLGLAAVAEGVASEDQVARLRELGGGLVQGHLFGRAGSADATLRLLRHGSKRLDNARVVAGGETPRPDTPHVRNRR